MHTIEDIILSNDRRGISSLRSHLPSNFCENAARLILENKGTVFITTGFYILNCGVPETDGPPGAMAIYKALEKLGCNVYIVTDEFSAPLMQGLIDDKNKVLIFPIIDFPTSERYARQLLDKHKPSLLISVERCGVTKYSRYLNMRGKDISNFNAKIDYLFEMHDKSIGIGDGGNEIGMGNLAEVIPTIQGLPGEPCITEVKSLIIASVSNWGGYGLVAAVSILAEKNLLLSIDEDRAIIERTADLGAVDGMKEKQIAGVDGFSLDENSQILSQLHLILNK